MLSKDVLSYIDTSSSTVKEVFSSVVNSESNATRDAAKAAVKAMCKELNESPAGSSIDYLRSISVDDFIAFAEAHNIDVSNGLKYKLLVKPFKGLWLRVASFMFDLNHDVIANLHERLDDRYFQVGDGIVLAGVYLILEDGE